MTYREYQAAKSKRAAVVARNNVLRLTGRRAECQPLPPKPDRPTCLVAYEADGSYAGRVESAENCPPGCTLRREVALY